MLIVAVLNGAVAFIDQMLTNLVPMTLHAEQYMIAASGGSMVQVLFDILLDFGVSLIVLKFLKKGFETYVLWTDGDPNVEPTYEVIRFIEAIAVAVCFPVLYGWLAEITQNLTDELLTAIGAATSYDWQAWVNGISSLGLGVHRLLLRSVLPVSYARLGATNSTNWPASRLCGATRQRQGRVQGYCSHARFK